MALRDRLYLEERVLMFCFNFASRVTTGGDARLPDQLNSFWIPAYEKKHLVWILAIFLSLVIGIEAAAYYSREPVRSYIEAEMNRRLTGYTVRINSLSLHPLRMSLDLENLVLSQKPHPDPPVADVRRLHASIRWLELLTFHLVGDVKIVKPVLHIDPKHLKGQMTEAPIEKESWQDALQAVYPLTINQLKITDGELTYVPEGLSKPFKVRDIKIIARNIKNIRSRDREYPSDLLIEAVFLESGKLTIRGGADFLLDPYAKGSSEVSPSYSKTA